MTTKRDCISCEYSYSRIDYNECGDCYKYSEHKPASKKELERRLKHITKMMNEKYPK